MPRIFPVSPPGNCSDILAQIDNDGRPVYNGSDKSIAGSDAGKICCFRRIIMKNITALLLGLVLLCSAAACAEETLPYLTTEDQDAYINTTLLSEDSYPQVCISPFSSYQLFDSNRAEPWYVTFPAPAGARCAEFGVDNCYYLDFDNNRQIAYQATDSYSYETFLNKCEDENNIILDGSDKVAAYINPERGNAYALLGLDEIKRGAKLYINIKQNNYNKIEENELAQLLKDVITAEAVRVQESMTCAQNEKFWTDGAFSGVNMFSYTIPGLRVIQDLPEISFHFDEGIFSAKPFVVNVSGEKFGACACDYTGKTVEISAEINTYSYVFYNREESEYTKVTLDDGSEWGVYVSNEKDGKPYVVYASRVLSEKDKRGNDRLTYFNYQVSSSRSNMYWADVNAFIGDLKALEQNLKLEGLPAAE